jgi:ABC-type phosphate transport system substrate-binding protein
MLAKDPWSDHCSIALEVLLGSLNTADKVKAVIPNSDGNTTSRNWRELKVTCPVSNIRILGPKPASGTSQCFQEIVFPLRAKGGSFETRREGGYFNSSMDETVVDYIETSIEKTYGDAIAYMDFLYYEEEGCPLVWSPH